MPKLYALNELVTRYVDKSNEFYEGNKVKHRLLNGSYVVQDIGEPSRQFDIICHVTGEGKEILDRAYVNSSPLTLEKEGRYYECYLDTYPEVEQIIKPHRAKHEWFTLSFILYERGGD